MNKYGTFIVVVIGVVNIVLFCVWWNLISVTAEMPASERGYTMEALALNITILEIIIGLVAFFLAALGLFGFTEIKSAAIIRAVDAAEKEARQEAAAQMQKFLEQQRSQARAPGITESDGSYGVSDGAEGRVTRAGVTE